MRAVNANGIALLRRLEGLSLEAYQCAAGRWTVGWGHTGADVYQGLVITFEDAERLFMDDLQKHARGVEALVRVEITDNMFAALVSFTFNHGVGALATSTLLQKVNREDFLGAANEFLVWRYVDADPGPGRVMVVSKGQVRRRQLERELFLSGWAPRVA